MKMKSLLCFVVLCFVWIGAAAAKKKKQEKYVTLVEAYSQRTLPGMRRATPPPPAIHFIVLWENKQHPDAFLWRGDAGLLSCTVVKVHKITEKTVRAPMGIDYYSEKIDIKAITKGDTLDVVPIPESAANVADGVSNVPSTGNTLFFETSGKHGTGMNWIRVDTIKKKRDIAMP